MINAPFADRCLTAAEAAWKASFAHPFVRALADGSLDAERFRFYQMQDARYLEAFADGCALVSTRCKNPADKVWFLHSAHEALVVERAMHEEYGQRLGYTVDDIASLTLTPSCRAYQDHMVACALRGSLLEAVAALSPCPLLYMDLGQALLADLGAIPDDHPYADWLRMYSGDTFEEHRDAWRRLLQKFSQGADDATRAAAVEAFVLSARYEWMFWEQAWTLQPWPV